MNIDYILFKLSKSKFRSSFHLKEKELNYLKEKGMETIKEHTQKFIEEKLAPANPKNDGRQTPMKNHPVFIAMHACACCCRSCLYKWHHIPMNKPLNKEEKEYILKLLLKWIENEVNYKNNNDFLN